MWSTWPQISCKQVITCRSDQLWPLLREIYLLHSGALLNLINPACFKKMSFTVYLQAVFSSPNQLISFIQSPPAMFFSRQPSVSCHKSKMLSPLFVCCYIRAEAELSIHDLKSIHQSEVSFQEFTDLHSSSHHQCLGWRKVAFNQTRPEALVCQTTSLGVVLCVQPAHRTVLSRLHNKSIFQIIFLIRFSCLRIFAIS